MKTNKYYCHRKLYNYRIRNQRALIYNLLQFLKYPKNSGFILLITILFKDHNVKTNINNNNTIIRKCVISTRGVENVWHNQLRYEFAMSNMIKKME